MNTLTLFMLICFVISVIVLAGTIIADKRDRKKNRNKSIYDYL